MNNYEAPESLESPDDLGIDFPDFLEPLLSQSYGAQDVERILRGSVRRKTTLRANTLLSDRAEVAAALTHAGIEHRPVSWYEDAFIIEHAREDAIWPLDIYQQGKIYLQSLSSMMPPLVVDPRPGLDILDMCAAPGGKATQMAALGGPGCTITACELSAPRAEKLEHNLNKLGCGGVTVLRQDARRLDSFFRFDRILVDAPCSGSGTLLARDPKMFRWFTPELVDKCARQQAALLDKAFELVKPGGFIVYSTCSVLPSENEHQLTAAMDRACKRGSFDVQPIAFTGANDIPTLPNTLPGTLTVCPTECYEGFFVACVKRLR